MEERITELETRQAFQEETLRQLNDALVEQQRQIDRLTREVAVLREKLAQLQAAAEVVPQAEEGLPPHY